MHQGFQSSCLDWIRTKICKPGFSQTQFKHSPQASGPSTSTSSPWWGFGTSVCSCPLMRVSFASLLVLTIQVMNSSPGPGRLKLSTGQGLPCCVTWIVSSAYVPSCRAASCQPLTSRHLQKLSLVAVICLPRCHPLFPWTAAPVKVSEGL